MKKIIFLITILIVSSSINASIIDHVHGTNVQAEIITTIKDTDIAYYFTNHTWIKKNDDTGGVSAISFDIPNTLRFNYTGTKNFSVEVAGVQALLIDGKVCYGATIGGLLVVIDISNGDLYLFDSDGLINIFYIVKDN